MKDAWATHSHTNMEIEEKPKTEIAKELREAASTIRASFVFASSYEGHDYWQKVCQRLLDISYELEKYDSPQKCTCCKVHN